MKFIHKAHCWGGGGKSIECTYLVLAEGFVSTQLIIAVGMVNCPCIHMYGAFPSVGVARLHKRN